MCAASVMSIWWFASLEKVGKEWKVISFIHEYFSRFFFLWELELQLVAQQWWFGIPRDLFHTLHQQYMMISWYNPLLYLTTLPFIRYKHSRKPPSWSVSRLNSRYQLLPQAGLCKQSRNGVTGTPEKLTCTQLSLDNGVGGFLWASAASSLSENGGINIDPA